MTRTRSLRALKKGGFLHCGKYKQENKCSNRMGKKLNTTQRGAAQGILVLLFLVICFQIRFKLLKDPLEILTRINIQPQWNNNHIIKYFKKMVHIKDCNTAEISGVHCTYATPTQNLSKGVPWVGHLKGVPFSLSLKYQYHYFTHDWIILVSTMLKIASSYW